MKETVQQPAIPLSGIRMSLLVALLLSVLLPAPSPRVTTVVDASIPKGMFQLTNGFGSSGFYNSSLVKPLNRWHDKIETFSYGNFPSGYSVTTSGTFRGNPFHSSISLPDSPYLWLIPNRANMIIRVDKETGQMTNFSNWPDSGVADPSFGVRGGKFDLAAYDADTGLIWMVGGPILQLGIMSLNPQTGEMQEYLLRRQGTNYEALPEPGESRPWSGVFKQTGTNFLWLGVWRMNRVSRFDVTTTHTVDKVFTVKNNQYVGFVWDGGDYAWMPPRYTTMSAFHLKDHTFTDFTTWPNDFKSVPSPAAFHGGCMAQEDKLFLSPWNANMVIEVDTRSGGGGGAFGKILHGWTGWPADIPEALAEKFTGCSFDTLYLWFLPNKAPLMRFNPDTGIMNTGFFPKLDDDYELSGVVLDLFTRSIFIPPGSSSSSDKLVRIAFGGRWYGCNDVKAIPGGWANLGDDDCAKCSGTLGSEKGQDYIYYPCDRNDLCYCTDDGGTIPPQYQTRFTYCFNATMTFPGTASKEGVNETLCKECEFGKRGFFPCDRMDLCKCAPCGHLYKDRHSSCPPVPSQYANYTPGEETSTTGGTSTSGGICPPRATQLSSVERVTVPSAVVATGAATFEFRLGTGRENDPEAATWTFSEAVLQKTGLFSYSLLVVKTHPLPNLQGWFGILGGAPSGSPAPVTGQPVMVLDSAAFVGVNVSRVNITHAKISLPATPEYDIDLPETLTIALSEDAFLEPPTTPSPAAAGSSSGSGMACTPANPPRLYPMVELHFVPSSMQRLREAESLNDVTAAVTTVTMMTAAASGGGSGGAVALDVQNLALIAEFSCTPPLNRESMSNRRVLSPLMTEDNWVGMVVGNLLGVGILLIPHSIIVLILRKCMRNHTSWLDSFVLARYPNWTILHGIMTFEGFGLASINIFWDNAGDGGKVTLGVLGILMVLGASIGIPLLNRWAVTASYHLYDYRHDSTFGSKSMLWPLLPKGTWETAESRKPWASIFTSFRLKNMFAPLISLTPTLVLLVGLCFRPASLDGCASLFYVLSAAHFTWMIFLTWLRPHNSIPFNVLPIVNLFLVSCLLFTIAITLDHPKRALVNTSVSTVIVKIQLALTIFRWIVDLAHRFLGAKFLGNVDKHQIFERKGHLFLDQYVKHFKPADKDFLIQISQVAFDADESSDDGDEEKEEDNILEKERSLKKLQKAASKRKADSDEKRSTALTEEKMVEKEKGGDIVSSSSNTNRSGGGGGPSSNGETDSGEGDESSSSTATAPAATITKPNLQGKEQGKRGNAPAFSSPSDGSHQVQPSDRGSRKKLRGSIIKLANGGNSKIPFALTHQQQQPSPSSSSLKATTTNSSATKTRNHNKTPPSSAQAKVKEEDSLAAFVADVDEEEQKESKEAAAAWLDASKNSLGIEEDEI